jgi:Patatin phospholipase
MVQHQDASKQRDESALTLFRDTPLRRCFPKRAPSGEELRQLRNIGRNPPCLVARQSVRRPAQAGLVLEIDAGEGPLGGTEMDIVQLIYRPMEPLGAFKDFEFSRATMAARRRQGLSDVLIALQASPWLAPMPKELGVRVFDVMHEILTGRPEHV